MVGVRGTWNQTSVESKCKVSIWEYPVGGSCVSIHQELGRQGEVLAPWAPLPEVPEDRQRWCLAPSRGNLWESELLFGLISQLIVPGPQLISWSTITATGRGFYCCAFTTSQTPVGFYSTRQRGFLDFIWAPRPQVILSNWRATEEHRWEISKLIENNIANKCPETSKPSIFQ